MKMSDHNSLGWSVVPGFSASYTWFVQIVFGYYLPTRFGSDTCTICFMSELQYKHAVDKRLQYKIIPFQRHISSLVSHTICAMVLPHQF